MCMKQNYAVRIVEYATSKGNSIVITIGADEMVHFQDMIYMKVWGKGQRLYFLPSSPGGGIKLTENRTLTFSEKNMVESLRKYIGVYHELRFDPQTKYEYIDIEDQKEAEIAAGSRTGCANRIDNAKHTRSNTVKPIVEAEPSSEPETKPEPIQSAAADNKPDIMQGLKDMLAEYMCSDNFEAAKAITRVIKMCNTL